MPTGKRGRPRLYSDPLGQARYVRFPIPTEKRLMSEAEQQGVGMATIVRLAVDHYLDEQDTLRRIRDRVLSWKPSEEA